VGAMMKDYSADIIYMQQLLRDIYNLMQKREFWEARKLMNELILESKTVRILCDMMIEENEDAGR
jgi:uncharacterized protein YqgQ